MNLRWYGLFIDIEWLKTALIHSLLKFDWNPELGMVLQLVHHCNTKTKALRECISPLSYIVCVQTETLNFTFARKAILRIYIFAWLLSLWQHNIIISPCLTACQNIRNGVTFFVHFFSTATSILNLTISSESQWNIDSNDILSVQKYSQLFMHESNTFLVKICDSAHYVITSPRVTACCCDEAKTSDTVLHFCKFLFNPHFDIETDYIFRKPTKRCFQRCIVRLEIFLTFHTRVEYNTSFLPFKPMGLSVHRYAHKSENIISNQIESNLFAQIYHIDIGSSKSVHEQCQQGWKQH